MDSDADNIKRAQNVLAQVFQGDAVDKKVLKQTGFFDLTHVLVSVGDSIANSTMITMYLKEMGVPQVWVKAVNLDHEKLLRRVGADEVIIPEELAAKQLAGRVAIPGFLDYLPFDENILLKELTVEHWASQTLRQINLTNRFNVQVIALKTDPDPHFKYVPRADDPLKAGDTLVVMGPADQVVKIKS